MPLINSLPANIIFDSFDLVVVQWNRETQTLRRACGAQKAFSISPLSPAIRVLIAQWFHWHRRPTRQSVSIFPGLKLVACMSRTSVWQVLHARAWGPYRAGTPPVRPGGAPPPPPQGLALIFIPAGGGDPSPP